VGFVLGAHYRGFLDFQKLSRANKSIRNEKKTVRPTLRMPFSGVFKYSLYSLIAEKVNTTPRARKTPPITSSQNRWSECRKSAKAILNFSIMEVKEHINGY
jgi:hypothetical protein